MGNVQRRLRRDRAVDGGDDTGGPESRGGAPARNRKQRLGWHFHARRAGEAVQPGRCRDYRVSAGDDARSDNAMGARVAVEFF
jgi:hypothetical protein